MAFTVHKNSRHVIDDYLHIVQKWTENQCGKLKKFKISVHGITNPVIVRLQGAWNYGRFNTNLFFKEPYQLTKFT